MCRCSLLPQSSSLSGCSTLKPAELAACASRPKPPANGWRLPSRVKTATAAASQERAQVATVAVRAADHTAAVVIQQAAITKEADYAYQARRRTLDTRLVCNGLREPAAVAVTCSPMPSPPASLMQPPRNLHLLKAEERAL